MLRLVKGDIFETVKRYPLRTLRLRIYRKVRKDFAKEKITFRFANAITYGSDTALPSLTIVSCVTNRGSVVVEIERTEPSPMRTPTTPG